MSEIVKEDGTVSSLLPDTARLVGAFLAGRSRRTHDAYRNDLEAFAAHVGAADLDDAARRILACGLGSANEIALSWKNSMIEAGSAPASVNRRLAALRSLVKLARTIGLIPWTLEVPGVRSTPHRETRGPGSEGVARLLAELQGRNDPLSARNRAILRLLHDTALRRAEVAALTVEDLDFTTEKLRIMGKGRRETEAVALPEKTAAAIKAWLEVRAGTHAGPLFVALDRAGRTQPLRASSIYRLVRGLGRRAGVRARPHGLRHTAITTALAATNGDVRAVAAFSRHKDVRTVQL